MPAHRGVECRHTRRDAEEQAGLLVGDDDLAAGVQGGEGLSRPRAGLGEGGGQFGAGVVGPLAQDRARAAHRLGQPLGCLRRKVGAPGRDVEHRHGIAGHRVTNGHPGTDPLVEARAPVLGSADQHRSGGLERRAHPVRPRRPLRPARPRRHVALARAPQRLLVALDGEDATRAVGDGDDGPEALDLGRDRRRRAAQLGEHDLVLQRVLGGGLVAARTPPGPRQTRVDVVLLATAIPGRGHLGPDAAHAVVASEKTLARGGHRLVPLRVTHPMTPCGLAHGVYLAICGFLSQGLRSTGPRPGPSQVTAERVKARIASVKKATANSATTARLSQRLGGRRCSCPRCRAARCRAGRRGRSASAPSRA